MSPHTLLRASRVLLLPMLLSGCYGEEFDQRTNDLDACVVGDWERLGPRMANRSERTLHLHEDGTYLWRDSKESSGGEWRVQLRIGEWFQYDDNLIRTVVKSVMTTGTDEADADALALQALETDAEYSPPLIRAGTAHCDNRHYREQVLIKISSYPDVFRMKVYGGFDDSWPLRTPTSLHTTQLTLHSNGIAEILRTGEFFDRSEEDFSNVSHAAYARQSSLPDGTPVVALTDCTGQSGCDIPEPIPAGIEYEYVDWKTALSVGTRYGVGETSGAADYFSR